MSSGFEGFSNLPQNTSNNVADVQSQSPYNLSNCEIYFIKTMSQIVQDLDQLKKEQRALTDNMKELMTKFDCSVLYKNNAQR